MTAEFENHPLLELRRPEARAELTSALTALDAELPLRLQAPLAGGGEPGAETASVDPCAPERDVARLRWATLEQAARALEVALQARWPWRPLDELLKPPVGARLEQGA